MDQVTVLFAALQKLLASVYGRMHPVVYTSPAVEVVVPATSTERTLRDNWELAMTKLVSSLDCHLDVVEELALSQ